MHHHDSARARSARIRAAHDGEATQLDAMRRRTRTHEDLGARRAGWRAWALLLARLLRRRARHRIEEDDGAERPAAAS
jgi:hypothetical protein